MTVVYSSSTFQKEQHSLYLREIFSKLRSNNLKLRPDKCEIFRKEVTYLGHVISDDGVRPDSRKVEAISKYPDLKNIEDIKYFLGLVGYYRRFIKDSAKIAKPLTKLL